MWASRQPNITASETARMCVKNMRADNNAALKAKVLQSLPQFDANSTAYRAAGTNDTLHTVGPEEFPAPGGLSSTDMERLYDNHLSQSRTAYPIYHALRRSGPGERCTYCANQTADTLDHFIPKKVLPTLAIEPWNLVPSCSRCNRNLSNAWETDVSKRLIHPYFMPDLKRWLRAEVVNSADVYVVFRAEPDPSEVDAELATRIRAQFDALGLRETLGSLAIQEIRVIQHRLRTRFHTADLARDHLLEQCEEMFELDANSLRGVVYEATASNLTFIGNHLKTSDSGVR